MYNLVKMHITLKEKLDSLKGHIGFYYKDIDSGFTYGYKQNDLFEAASVIKFPILCAVYKIAYENRTDLGEYIKVKDSDKFPGCGTLKLYDDEPEVNIATLCRLMISVSDNSATNILIRKYGIDKLNEEFRSIGLLNSHIERFLFDAQSSKQGKENRVEPEEIGLLLERIYKGEFINEDISDEIMNILLSQQINHKVSILKQHDIKVAHKTGEDNGISNDVGIVLSDKPYVFCYLGNNTDTVEFEDFIRKSSYDLYSNSIIF